MLTTLQLSSQPQLYSNASQELKEEANGWEEKFQVAEAARLCMLKEVQRLQQQVQEWAELLDQGQARIHELEEELEGSRQEAHGEISAPESVPGLQDVLAAVERLQNKFR